MIIGTGSALGLLVNTLTRSHRAGPGAESARTVATKLAIRAIALKNCILVHRVRLKVASKQDSQEGPLNSQKGMMRAAYNQIREPILNAASLTPFSLVRVGTWSAKHLGSAELSAVCFPHWVLDLPPQ